VVDVGAGIGNVVYQCFFRTGCLCVGIEIDKRRYDLSVKLFGTPGGDIRDFSWVSIWNSHFGLYSVLFFSAELLTVRYVFTSLWHYKLLQRLGRITLLHADFREQYTDEKLKNPTVVIVNNAEGIFTSRSDPVESGLPSMDEAIGAYFAMAKAGTRLLAFDEIKSLEYGKSSQSFFQFGEITLSKGATTWNSPETERLVYLYERVGGTPYFTCSSCLKQCRALEAKKKRLRKQCTSCSASVHPLRKRSDGAGERNYSKKTKT